MNHTNPPRWILRMLSRFCPPDLFEEIEGDFLQGFHNDVGEFGYKRAKGRLIIRTVRFFRPGILFRNHRRDQGHPLILLQANVSMAIRQMQKNKIFSSITIFGLSTSLAACLLIFQYTNFELSYDQNISRSSNTYRLNVHSFENNSLRSISVLTPLDAVSKIRENVPGIETSAQLVSTAMWFDCSFTYRGNGTTRTFNESTVAYAEQSVLDIFNYRIIRGDPLQGLSLPFTMVISESVAKKYFGDEDPIEKTLHLRGSDDVHDYVVTAVMADPPLNAHFYFDILLSFSSTDQNASRKFYGSFAYIVLSPQTSKGDVQRKLTQIAKSIPGDNNRSFNFTMEPVADIHFYATAQDQPKPTADAATVYFLIAIAFLVVGLAWLNYINLNMARLVSRAKEIGVRKASGATRSQIAGQFMTETLVYNVISLCFAVVLVYMTAPTFYDFVGIHFPWDEPYWLQSGVKGWLIIVAFGATMFLSGALPACVMAAIPAVTVLKGNIIGISKGINFRRASVVFQFICAIGLMHTVITFNRQFQLITKKDPGFDFERTLIVKSPSNADSSFRTRLAQLRHTLRQQSVVDNVFTAGNVFTDGEAWTAPMRRENERTREDFLVNIIDPGFIDGYGLTLLAGRNFDVDDYPGNQFGQKTEPLILNETGSARLGFESPADAIGATIYWDENRCRVVGVINDFHQRSMREVIGPAIYTANNGSSLSLQLMPGAMGENLGSSIQVIQREWDKMFPENAFDFFMLRDFYGGLYKTERQMKNLFQFFCVLALTISSLGLFALSLFSVNQRAKEMSIRKILGATVIHLFRLLTNEYLLMITIAGSIAIPVTWIFIDRWLRGFALKIELTPADGLIPFVIVLFLALTAIMTHTSRVISRNPSETLRAE